MSAPRILVVDDESDIRSTLKEVLTDEGHEVDVAADAAQARAARARHEPDLVLLDIWMPDTDGITLLREWSSQGPLSCPVVMMSGHGTVETAVEATRLGAFDFVEKPLSLAKLLRVVERALESGRRKRVAARALVPSLVAPVGKSKLMQQLRDQILQIAPRDSSVLLLGEPGTGREAFARYLHSLSPRADKPFVVVAGGSLDEANAAQRLRGAEHGGEVVVGLYQQAEGGTLYLAGLEDFSPAVQRLLSADLDAGAYTREDGRQAQPLAVRIVSGAQPGVEQREDPEPLRRDLLAHLNLITLQVPPLRDQARTSAVSASSLAYCSSMV